MSLRYHVNWIIFKNNIDLEYFGQVCMPWCRLQQPKQVINSLQIPAKKKIIITHYFRMLKYTTITSLKQHNFLLSSKPPQNIFQQIKFKDSWWRNFVVKSWNVWILQNCSEFNNLYYHHFVTWMEEQSIGIKGNIGLLFF